MAMSLEDLLAEEGFKRRKAKIKPRTSFASEGRSMPPYRGDHEPGTLLKRTDRTRSHIPRYDSKGEFSISSSFTGRKPRDNLMNRGRVGLESEKRTSLDHGRRGRRDSWDAKRFSVGPSEDLLGSEITEVVESDERVFGHEEDEESERHRRNIVIDDKETRNNSLKHPRSSESFKGNNRRSMKQPQSSGNRSDGIPVSDKVFDESRSLRQPKFEQAIATPALDEVAVKAIISILNRHIKRFVKDEEFRTSLHHNSFASLNFLGLDDGPDTESKVIENLEQAVETVERAAEETATSKELKRATMQLSVITGLNSNDLKDGFTSGIPNFKLSACAHLYLSLIYMLQKKDGIAAKHLLQVFCDSPFQARTRLLPELWENVFLPHLLHLKLWYNKESQSLSDSPVLMNLRRLEKVYNESLDSGTYLFAMYYKDWITEGGEAPSVPLIKIPAFSLQLMPTGGLHGHASSPASHVSSQPMVSKKLYDEVFRHSHKSGVELEVYEDDNFDVSARSSSSPAPEDKQLILYSDDSVSATDRNFEPDGESPSDNLPPAEEAQRLHSSAVANLDRARQGNSPVDENKFLLEWRENRVIELKQIKNSVHDAQQQENDDNLRGKPSLFSIPEDFLCPLTGLLFKDPVTLETGQTFEREAIVDWFGKGWLTCPVTRKTLQCRAVPPTNLILKRVIDQWKTDHFEHLLALLSQVAGGSKENIDVDDSVTVCILEQLSTIFSKDERIMNARRIISFGGLQFLLRRFHCGSAEERTFILPLLSCCVEADSGCRNDVARNLNGSILLQLLHSEHLKLRTDAVSLLAELICLNRRNGAKSFLEGLYDEGIINAMDDLLVYLQSCPMEQTPLVAVLLLHLDLLSETHCSSNIYRQEAVDALTTTLERSLSSETIQKKCSRALLILGGVFSSSGKLMTEDWILKLAGFLNGPDWDITDKEASDMTADATATTVDLLTEDGDEENAREMWLLSLSPSLLGDGKKSFLGSISKCLSLGNSDLVRACLITVAWLSSSLASLPDTEFQLLAFSALFSPLKQCLEHGELVEHRILASLSLLNFSTIPECRILLKKIAEEIGSCLENLAEVTWTAKELHTVISGQRR
ncbi:putative E3 ubiquitin-protein ligase LIN [Sesamum alatum]|uniref:RING-type E3 ubiquitin transferase n=1 Tax=Sesamum alatum TaxID=300844 RepID=A0AAE2CEU0_9LAMI|nr:putative E3 ubiquitin-protein ligase LIN [Sesamum alatum]